MFETARPPPSPGIHRSRLEPCSVTAVGSIFRLDRSIGEKRNEGHALAPRDPGQKLHDRGLEMVGRLMRGPGGLVDVELEDKEQQWVRRGAVGKEKLDAGLRHRRWRHAPEDLGKCVRLALLGFKYDRNDEAVVQGFQRVGRDPIGEHPCLHGQGSVAASLARRVRGMVRWRSKFPGAIWSIAGPRGVSEPPDSKSTSSRATNPNHP